MIDSTRSVDLSAAYQGRIRMTLTPPVIDAARARVVFVTGADKADAIATWLDGPQQGLPIERVPTDGTVVVLDAAAASRLTRGAS